ncbi:MAG: alpha/beta hydrolase fold domain-containing protein [Cyanobacteria bacterium REEB67]|nr:alpha/beta hydrolase fold domain-containing protein [Cyanobacteria bacterium REEB67]
MSGQTKKPAVIYLHGFASGIGSTKAQYFQDRLLKAGYELALPDLNVPTFSDMTLSAQLEKVETVARDFAEGRDLILIGSSLGGLLATIASQKLKSRSLKVQRLILLAPGFGIKERWQELIGAEELDRWRKTGSKSYFHYGLKKELGLKYSFIEDLKNHQTDDLKINLPTLVFHGIKDDTVPIEKSKRFAALNGDLVELHELVDGHELIASLAVMWDRSANFMKE